VSHYLCSCWFAEESLKRSPLYHVDRFIPVGQYRSDNLVSAKTSPLPREIENAKARGLRIVTALGFHSHTEWQDSQRDVLLNWKAHQQFLDDMIQLSKDILGIFIILRYKDVDWLSAPVFADTVRKIQSMDTIAISTDYSKSFVSYDLCAHSDLVIAKHTSLADECLSVGIPVLFHDYTHNTERLLADSYDYLPAEIMCFNYPDLLKRAKIVLGVKPNPMTGGYEFLQNEIFGGLGDGRVSGRIHTYVENMLSER
jgi:hypothetical protein